MGADGEDSFSLGLPSEEAHAAAAEEPCDRRGAEAGVGESESVEALAEVEYPTEVPEVFPCFVCLRKDTDPVANESPNSNSNFPLKLPPKHPRNSLETPTRHSLETSS